MTGWKESTFTLFYNKNHKLFRVHYNSEYEIKDHCKLYLGTLGRLQFKANSYSQYECFDGTLRELQWQIWSNENVIFKVHRTDY